MVWSKNKIFFQLSQPFSAKEAKSICQKKLTELKIFIILIYFYTTSMVQGGCKTTELKVFYDLEPLKLKL